MPDLSSDQEIVALVRRTIALWNANDFTRLGLQFREDAALCSPFVGPEESRWMVGRDEIIEHLEKVQSRRPSFKISNAFSDTALYTLLLTNGHEDLCIVLEPDPVDMLVRRMIICTSLLEP